MSKNILRTKWNTRKSDQVSLLLDAEDVAVLLGCCSKTVRSLAKAGKLKSLRIGRLQKFTRQAIEDFVLQEEAFIRDAGISRGRR
ncbi:helix-turn-helix domain-containing protein [Poriferisphaera sp. WC338]|uniref:helix-turn-helix domain-containing protein n=1 Tax=Poriferisphaera sp. WC338 TaxID=3425129 RepID=UPI003D814C8F